MNSRRTPAPAPPAPSMAAPKAGRLPLLLVGLVLLAFCRLLSFGFTPFDDGVNIYQNERFNPPALHNVLAYWEEWKTGAAGLYIPVTYTIWGALAKATWVPTPDEVGNHLDGRIFHGVNVLAHALAACAVFALLNRLVRRPQAAFAGAALFALHPVQVESVGWVSGLKDVLCGLLSITAVWQYVAAAQATEASSKPPHHRRALWHYLAGLVAFVMAMLCKPTAMVTPAMVFVVDVWVLRRPLKRVLAWIALWAVIAVPFMYIARLVQDVEGISNAALWARPFVAGDALAFYVWKLLSAYPLYFDYGLSPRAMLSHSWGHIAWTLPVLLAVLAWWRRTKSYLPWAAVLLFTVPLLPNSGLATFQYLYYSVVADHYLYTAMLGPALLLAWLVARFPYRGVKVACVIALGALMVRTVDQTGVWKDNWALTRQSLAHNPNGFLAHGNLGGSYDDRAKQLLVDANLARTEGNLPQAHDLIEQAREAVRRAHEEYGIAARLDPDSIHTWVNLVSLDLRAGQDAAALQEGKELARVAHFLPYRAAVQAVPSFQDLAMNAEAQGRYADAAYFLQQGLALAPNHSKLRASLQRVRAKIAAAPALPATTRAVAGPATR